MGFCFVFLGVFLAFFLVVVFWRVVCLFVVGFLLVFLFVCFLYFLMRISDKSHDYRDSAYRRCLCLFIDEVDNVYIILQQLISLRVLSTVV